MAIFEHLALVCTIVLMNDLGLILDRSFAGDSDFDTDIIFIKLPAAVLRYFNVLYIWSVRAIPTYRVYRLCD